MVNESRLNRRTSASAGLGRWAAARATTALRRTRLISTVGALAGASVFFVLLLLPREADRALRSRIAALPPSVDTTSLQRRLGEARDSMRARQEQLSALQVQQQQDSMFVVSVTDATGVPRVVVGDTLRAQLAERLRVARATPIVESFLALAATPALASDSTAQLVADSLRVAEQERGALATLGPDSRYRALQERVSELGDRLVERASIRLGDDQLSEQTQALRADTALAAAHSALRLATDSVNQLETSLRRAAEWNLRRVEQERELRAAEPLRVPTLPMLLAVLTIATSTGYLAAFAAEWREPRVADASEVATIVERAGLDATVVMHERSSTSPPRKRAVDRALPAVLRRDSSAYDRLHQQLSTIGSAVSVVGVLSDDAEQTAVAAAQLAAAAAEASRAVLLIDADVVRRRVAPTVGKTQLAGLADVARGRIELASALATVQTGRDNGITLLPAGPTTTPHALLAEIAPELQRLMQRHDLSVIALATDASAWPTQLLPHDVVVAVAPGLTPVDWLSEALRSAGRAGQRVRGVMVLHTNT